MTSLNVTKEVIFDLSLLEIEVTADCCGSKWNLLANFQCRLKCKLLWSDAVWNVTRTLPLHCSPRANVSRLHLPVCASCHRHVSRFLIEQSNKWQVRHCHHGDRLFTFWQSTARNCDVIAVRMMALLIVAKLQKVEKKETDEPSRIEGTGEWEKEMQPLRHSESLTENWSKAGCEKGIERK